MKIKKVLLATALYACLTGCSYAKDKYEPPVYAKFYLHISSAHEAAVSGQSCESIEKHLLKIVNENKSVNKNKSGADGSCYESQHTLEKVMDFYATHKSSWNAIERGLARKMICEIAEKMEDSYLHEQIESFFKLKLKESPNASLFHLIFMYNHNRSQGMGSMQSLGSTGIRYSKDAEWGYGGKRNLKSAYSLVQEAFETMMPSPVFQRAENLSE